MELFRRVGRDVKLAKYRVVHVRQEPANLFGAGKNPAETGVGKSRVATKLGLRRFFQHNDFRRAGLLRRNRRLESRAATAYNHHWNIFRSHRSGLPLKKTRNPNIEIRNKPEARE